MGSSQAGIRRVATAGASLLSVHLRITLQHLIHPRLLFSAFSDCRACSAFGSHLFDCQCKVDQLVTSVHPPQN